MGPTFLYKLQDDFSSRLEYAYINLVWIVVGCLFVDHLWSTLLQGFIEKGLNVNANSNIKTFFKWQIANFLKCHASIIIRNEPVLGFILTPKKTIK